MTGRLHYGLAVAAALVVAVALLPLSVALALLPRGSPLTAREATGTLWQGMLVEATIAGVAVGDAEVRANAFALLGGTGRLSVHGPKVAGVLIGAGDMNGVEQLTGTVDVAAWLAPLPISALGFDDASIVFRDNRCDSAQGSVRATLVGDLGGIALPGGLSGALRCDGAALLMPLGSQSGLERIDVRIAANGRWRATIAIRDSDPTMAAKLTASGFRPGGGGVVLDLAGTF